MFRFVQFGISRSLSTSTFIFNGKQIGGGQGFLKRWTRCDDKIGCAFQTIRQMHMIDSEQGLSKKGKIYTIEENEICEEVFRENMYPDKDVCERLAKKFGRSTKSVQYKFSYMRKEYSKMYGAKLEPPNEFTCDDLKILHTSFDRNNWPDQVERNRLAIVLGRSIHSIKRWFVVQRKKKVLPGKIENKSKKFTDAQIKKLESVFTEQTYPDSGVIRSLSCEFEREEQSIRYWFNRHRKIHGTTIKKGFHYTEEDHKLLKTEYQNNPFPSIKKTKEIADVLGRSVGGIKYQFHVMRRNNPLKVQQKSNWLTTAYTCEEKQLLQNMFQKNKLSFVLSPNKINYPKNDIIEICEQLGTTEKRVKKWITCKRESEIKKLGLTKSIPSYTNDQIDEMSKFISSDYPNNREFYTYFAEKYGRTENAIRCWFYAQKIGEYQNLTPHEKSKLQLEKNQQIKNTLENHFKQNLFLSDDEIQDIVDEVQMSFPRVKSSLENYRLSFAKKIGKEEFQKRIEAGNFTAIQVRKKPEWIRKN